MAKHEVLRVNLTIEWAARGEVWYDGTPQLSNESGPLQMGYLFYKWMIIDHSVEHTSDGVIHHYKAMASYVQGRR